MMSCSGGARNSRRDSRLNWDGALATDLKFRGCRIQLLRGHQASGDRWAPRYSSNANAAGIAWMKMMLVLAVNPP